MTITDPRAAFLDKALASGEATVKLSSHDEAWRLRRTLYEFRNSYRGSPKREPYMELRFELRPENLAKPEGPCILVARRHRGPVDLLEVLKKSL
jgi:hypothetical protein